MTTKEPKPTFAECVAAQDIVDRYQKPILACAKSYFWYQEAVSGEEPVIEFGVKKGIPYITVSVYCRNHWYFLEPPMVESEEVCRWINAKTEERLVEIERLEQEHKAKRQAEVDTVDRRLLERIKKDHPDWNLSIP